ncbi:unnamed protein product [Paramecium primaurelia]|uniref:Uncharacterized protein n=1 Tax=Paramecium primaurelia TaxID=5886 RepID=A0A8S1P053_PARPR|nr:unnamed protein product [Paramecium primaurelia]
MNQQNDQIVLQVGESKNSKKVGKWDIIYKEKLIGGGSYDEEGNGIKIGKWIEINGGFNQGSQVIFSGDYKNGNKVGRWDILFRRDEDCPFIFIGGGQYDEEGQGLKIGDWIETNELFMDGSQVTFNGQYKNGKRLGRWDILFRNFEYNPFIQIGGGYYDEEGLGLKIGNWIEISDGFMDGSQVAFNGEYKFGQKVGIWKILYRSSDDNPFSQIGGGQYDEEGNGMKIGSWIEISDEFRNQSQVINNGDYQNGKKVSRWDIWYRDNDDELVSEKIGGGSYDEFGAGMKIGKWIELDNRFYKDKQVTFIGEYKNDKKIGRWDILWRYYSSDPFSQMQLILFIVRQNQYFSGGGSYDDRGDGMKIGRWIELYDGFKWNTQVIWDGEYKYEKKFGRWDIQYKRNKYTPYQQMQKYIQNLFINMLVAVDNMMKMV